MYTSPLQAVKTPPEVLEGLGSSTNWVFLSDTSFRDPVRFARYSASVCGQVRFSVCPLVSLDPTMPSQSPRGYCHCLLCRCSIHDLAGWFNQQLRGPSNRPLTVIIFHFFLAEFQVLNMFPSSLSVLLRPPRLLGAFYRRPRALVTSLCKPSASGTFSGLLRRGVE